MPTVTYTLNIPLNGTGTEIPALNITDNYQAYVISGATTATGNYAIVPTGAPTLGITYYFRYRATLDITTNGTTFAIFGANITQAQLLKQWDALCYFNGSSWDVNLHMDFSESSIVSSDNIGNATIINANIANGTIHLGNKGIVESLDNTKIAPNTIVGSTKIAPLTITNAEINDVNGSKLATSSVANDKLATIPDQTLKGNISGGTSNPSDISIPTLFNGRSWSLTGNSGTVAGTNFIGTTDAVDLVFKISGLEAGRLAVSGANTSFGGASLISRTTGTNNAAFGATSLGQVTTGINNTAFGSVSGFAITTGSHNVSIGYNNLSTLTTGNNNIAIGKEAGVDSATATNRIAIGTNAVSDVDNQFAIADSITEIKAVGIAKIRYNALPAYNDNTAAAAALDAGELFVTTGSGALARGIVCQVY